MVGHIYITNTSIRFTGVADRVHIHMSTGILYTVVRCCRFFFSLSLYYGFILICCFVYEVAWPIRHAWFLLTRGPVTQSTLGCTLVCL